MRSPIYSLEYLGRAGLLVLFLLAIACGSDGPAPNQAQAAQATSDQMTAPGPSTQDPCTLVTNAEAREIVGQEVAGPAPNQSNNRLCEFRVGEEGATVSFMMEPSYGSAAIDEFVSQMRAHNVDVTPVDGIGDQSFWTPQPGITQLNTFVGAHHVILTMAFVADDARQEELCKQFMKKALEKL